MLDIELFKNLDIEKKRHYLSSIIHPIIENIKDWEKNLEIFLFWSFEYELVEFYEILRDKEKEKKYILNKCEEINNENLKIKRLQRSLVTAIVDIKEKSERKNVENIVDSI